MSYLNCRKSKNGKTYCWDDELQCLVELVVKPIKVENVPVDVIQDLFKEVKDKK